MTKAQSKILSDQQLLNALQSEGSEVLEQLYLSYREDFIAFARKYKAKEEDILDVYQDSIIAFFENVKAGKITTLSSSIKTYLFSIGKYKLIDKLKQSGKQLQLEQVEQIKESIENTFEDHLELSHRQSLLRDAINKIGGSCKELLLLFYYRQYSIEAIQIEMGFKNENTVKANKSRCIKSLRTIIKKEDII